VYDGAGNIREGVSGAGKSYVDSDSGEKRPRVLGYCSCTVTTADVDIRFTYFTAVFNVFYMITFFAIKKLKPYLV